MKAKVIYIIATAALILSAFFIGKFTAPTVIKTEIPTVLQTDNSDMLNMNKIYDNMSKDELIAQCIDKDSQIDVYNSQIKKYQVLTKTDIMSIYKCESNKALRILKLMFQMGYGNKIGKEYYISLESQNDFLTAMRGKEVFI